MDAKTRSDSATALAQLAAGLVLGAPSEQLAARLFESLSPALELDTYVHYVHRRGDEDLTLAGWQGITDEQAASIRSLPIGDAVCGWVAREARAHAVADIPSTTDPRYALLRDFGLTAYACHPLLADTQDLGHDSGVLGTLSFGSRSRLSFDDEEVSLLRTASDILAAGLARSQAEDLSDELRARLSEAEEKIEQLQHALDSRVVIEQAKGVVAQRHGVDVGEAFELLRGHSRRTRTKLRDVARDVVDGGELPEA